MRFLNQYFDPFLKYMRQEGRCEKTVREYQRMFQGAFAHAYLGNVLLKDQKLRKLKLTDVAALKEAAREHGEFGPQRAVVTLRLLLKYLKNSGEKVPFDWRDLEVPKVPAKVKPYLNAQGFQELADKVPIDCLWGFRLRTIVELVFATAMRIGEVVATTQDCVNWQKQEIFIEKVKGKGQGIGLLTERAVDWLRRYLNTRFDSLDALFVNEQGNVPLCTAVARKNLQMFRQRAGIKERITFTTIRSAHANAMLEGGATIKEVQVSMRHASERTTLRHYLSVSQARVRAVHRRILGEV